MLISRGGGEASRQGETHWLQWAARPAGSRPYLGRQSGRSDNAVNNGWGSEGTHGENRVSKQLRLAAIKRGVAPPGSTIGPGNPSLSEPAQAARPAPEQTSFICLFALSGPLGQATLGRARSGRAELIRTTISGTHSPRLMVRKESSGTGETCISFIRPEDRGRVGREPGEGREHHIFPVIEGLECGRGG